MQPLMNADRVCTVQRVICSRCRVSVRMVFQARLAMFAGITSAPFRGLCSTYGAEMCTSEMIIASTLLDRKPAALALARWAAGTAFLP